MKARAYAVAVACLLLAETAHAGPVEQLEGLSIAQGDPSTWVLRYRYAGGGFFVSHDSGKTFAMVCNSAVDSSLHREASATTVASDGTISFGVADGMWRGDRDGCGFASVSSLAGRWVNDFAPDPLDPERTYAVTSAGGKDNGIFVNRVGSDGWEALGTQEKILINRLRVTPLGQGNARFYETIVRGTIEIADADGGVDEVLPNYVVRYSDDLGETWTEHDFGQTDGTVTLLGVEPGNPDNIVVAVLRDDVGPTALPDDILFSDRRGEPGSFKKLGEVSELGGIAFAPDGRLFYGDRFHDSPALYVAASLAEEPRLLSQEYKVSCLTYDAQTDKLYVCQDTLLGAVNVETGAFTELFDIAQADQFASCDAPGSVASSCEAQLLSGYCGFTHYFCAPLCADYGAPDSDGNTPTDSALCDNGRAADAGNGGGDTQLPDSGTGTAPGRGGSDCGCTAPGSRAPGGGAAFVAMGLLVLLRRRRAGRHAVFTDLLEATADEQRRQTRKP